MPEHSKVGTGGPEGKRQTGCQAIGNNKDKVVPLDDG